MHNWTWDVEACSGAYWLGKTLICRANQWGKLDAEDDALNVYEH